MARMYNTVVVAGLLGLLGLVSGCASEQGAMQGSTGAGTGAGTVAAKGAAEPMNDSLTACLARIPKDSSEGARMVAEQSCRSNDAYTQTVSGMASTKSGNRASAGTQGDSLDACLSRIPKDASAGQRMLAESSCQRDLTTHR